MADLQNVTYGEQAFTIPTYDDTALANRVSANETAIADRYTKEQTDEKIAEGIATVDSEHFHPVTVLPDVADAKENHEYILIEYEQDGVTIKSKTFYLFYDGAYHEDRAAGVSLEGYATEQYVDDGLDTKQDTLVSGTNIKTINGLSLVGEGNVILHQGVGDGLDVNDMPTYNEVEQMINDHALLYIDGNWLVQSIEKEGDTATIRGTFNNQSRSYYFDCEGLDDPLVYQDNYTDAYTDDAVLWGSASGSQPYMEIQNSNKDTLRVWGLNGSIALDIKDRNGREVHREYNITPNYIVDKPEGTPTQLGNVVQIGTLQRESGDEVGIFEFYYRTSALPNTTTKEFTLLPLLADYTVNDFIDATGITTNGIFIGNGRTDNNNRLIVQQFSKNNKTVTIRTYQDFSSHTALLKIQFIGTKNA